MYIYNTRLITHTQERALTAHYHIFRGEIEPCVQCTLRQFTCGYHAVEQGVGGQPDDKVVELAVRNAAWYGGMAYKCSTCIEVGSFIDSGSAVCTVLACGVNNRRYAI